LYATPYTNKTRAKLKSGNYYHFVRLGEWQHIGCGGHPIEFEPGHWKCCKCIWIYPGWDPPELLEGTVYERLSEGDNRRDLLKRGSLLKPELYGDFTDKSWSDGFENKDDFLASQISYETIILREHGII
jgi:hypothetical protein